MNLRLLPIGAARQALLPACAALLVAAGPVWAQQPTAAQRDTAAQGDSVVTVLTPNAGVHDSVALGMQRGIQAARHEQTSQWVFRGFLGGVTLGPFGAGAAYVAANHSEVALTPQHRMLLLQEGGAAYAAAYQDAYAEALLARRKRSALTGGALGTAALVTVLTTIWAVYYYY